jgi:1-acyl-sn-glycerol-3-phosphate acyltransferase
MNSRVGARPLFGFRLNLTQRLARVILRFFGWKIKDKLPPLSKYVLIGAPHTSNWDGILMILVIWALPLKLTWVGKDSLFRWPLGWFMRSLGGIPVNRRAKNNFTQQMIQEFSQREQLYLAIAPEGTRSKTKRWKTGFYYIALGAGVPIVLASLDYENKEVGLEKLLVPTSELSADFEIIRAFYAPFKGKNPHLQGEITYQEPNQQG